MRQEKYLERHSERYSEGHAEGHSIDTVFALILFSVFGLCSVLLVLLGAGIYGRSAEEMNRIDTPVILSYLTEKLRSCGQQDGIVLEQTGTGQDRMLLSEHDAKGEYVTWIYVENGSLKEALMPKGREPIENGGNEIARVQLFEVGELPGGLLEMKVTDGAGQTGFRYYKLEEKL